MQAYQNDNELIARLELQDRVISRNALEVTKFTKPGDHLLAEPCILEASLATSGGFFKAASCGPEISTALPPSLSLLSDGRRGRRWRVYDVQCAAISAKPQRRQNDRQARPVSVGARTGPV